MRLSFALLLCGGLVVWMAAAAATQPAIPDDSSEGSQGDCRRNPRSCGVPIRISDDLGGVDNCAGPNCLTNRIVNLGDLATDFLPFPVRGEFRPVPAGEAEDGSPTCTPEPAGRMPAAWWQVPVPAFGAVGMNPAPEALTGLESWFWYEGETEVTWPSPVFAGVRADCSVIPAPAPVTYTAAISSFDWEIDDSRPARATSTGPGAEDEPAARHTYRTSGDWSVRVRCTWSGSPAGDLPWDCARRTVPVTSFRSVLTD